MTTEEAPERVSECWEKVIENDGCRALPPPSENGAGTGQSRVLIVDIQSANLLTLAYNTTSYGLPDQVGCIT